MKTRTMIVSALIALVSLSCAKEISRTDLIENEGPAITFSALAEQEPVVKTDLSGNDADGYYVFWTTGDKIRISGWKEGKLTGDAKPITDGIGTAIGTFTTTLGPAPTSPAYEFLYPSNYPIGSSTALSITSQNAYVGNQLYKSTGPEFFPMYARTDEQTPSHVQFSNILGIIRVRIENVGGEDLVIKRLDYTANKGLMGTWSYEETPDGHYKAVLKAGKPLSLDCEEGVTIASGATAPFFVSAFDGEYSSLDIVVTDGSDKTSTISLKQGKTFRIQRSMISDIAVKLSSDSFTSPTEIIYECSTDEILVKYPVSSGFPTNSAAANPASVSVTAHTYDNSTHKGVITLASDLTVVGYRAFADCGNVSKVVIPSTVTTIGQEAFSGCTSLSEFKMPSSVKALNTSAFEGCTGLVSVKISPAVATLSQASFKGCTSLKTVEIPASVTIINTSAFEGSGLTAVTLPGGLLTLNSNAFKDCKALKSVSVPSTVTTLGNNLFQGCDSLETVNIPDNESIVKLNQNMFYGCGSLVHVDIPSHIVTLGTQVFYNCSKLESVDVSNITSYDANGGQFYGCSALESIVFNPAVTAIPKTICKGCSSITAVTVPANVLTIGHQAFNNCENLEYVTFERYESGESYPADVTSRLVSPTTYNVDQFSLCPKLLVAGHMIVPKGSIDDYKKAWTWDEVWNDKPYKGSYADWFVEAE